MITSYRMGLFVICFILMTAFPANACTSFFIQTNDTMLFGNTMDINVGDAYLFINKRNVAKKGLWYTDAQSWTSKYGSITINMFGREFPTRGMNEAGLVLGEMNLPETVYPYSDNRSRIIVLQWIQYILDNCATIEDVLAHNELLRISQEDQNKCHFLISDANGHSIVMEWLNGSLTLYSYNNLPVAALTNNTYASLLTYYNRGVAPSENDVSSTGRFYHAANMIKKYNPSKDGSVIDYAFEMLDKVENPGFTKWRLLFDMTNKRLYFDTYNYKKIRFIDIDSFNLSCNSPVKMIRLYDIIEGDINTSLLDFDYEINKAHLISFASKMGYGNPEWLSAYYNFPASTTCMENFNSVNVSPLIRRNIIRSVSTNDGLLHIALNTKTGGPVLLQIISMNGIIMKSTRTESGGNFETQIDLDKKGLSQGIYLIRCSIGTIQETQKLVIQ